MIRICLLSSQSACDKSCMDEIPTLTSYIPMTLLPYLTLPPAKILFKNKVSFKQELELFVVVFL